MESNIREADFTLTESTTFIHRQTGIDEYLMSFDESLNMWHTNGTREKFMKKQINAWVTAGWGQEALKILQQELAALPGAPEPFGVVPGGVG